MGWAAETASQNIALERDALSEPASKRKPHPALERGLRTKAGPCSGSDWSSPESLMLAGVGTEINERLGRYNDTLWRPYAFFPPFCYICLRHCACRNGGHPLSPVFIFNRPGVRCNALARYPGRMPRGVCSWCCAMQGGMRRPRHLGAIGVFLGVIATVPEWADLAFYARGDSIPIVFAPIWLLHGVSCVSCFVGSLLLSYVIWGTADSPLTQRSTRTDERETRHPQDAIFTETIAVMSCLLFCCRVSWRIVPEPWGIPSVSAASIGLALLIPLVYLALTVAPLFCRPRAFGHGRRDVFARSALVAVPIGLVPAVEAAYFASDAVVIALLAMGSVIAAAFVCMLLRGKRDNNSDIACASDTFDAGVFSPALSPREEQFVRLLLKGKTPAEIAKETDTKPSTVRTTLHRAYGKASVAGSRELVALFAGEGDTVGYELPQRHADDMAASARTRRLFRYLLTLFLSSLRRGPW